MKRSLLLGMASIAFVMAGIAPAHAQLAKQNTTAGAGRVKEQITPPAFASSSLNPLEVTQGVIQTAPAGAENVHFVLNGIDLQGVTAYREDQLAPVYADSIGKTISLADLYDIAAKLTNKFRNDGYVLTQVVVPPQTIGKSGSTVKLQVVEGYVDSVNVTMEPNALPESTAAMNLIRGYAARINTGKALNVKDLERYMLLINDLPGMTGRGVLSPSANKTGAADLTILVSRDRAEGRVGLDNYGTRFLGPWQASVSGATNSLLGLNERLTGQIVFAPDVGHDPELGYFAVGYQQPLLSNGLRFDLDISQSETNPGYTLRQFNVRGHATNYVADIFYPVIRSRATNFYTKLIYDMRDVRTSNNIELTRIDHIRVARANARLEHLDTVFGAGLNVAELEVSRGLDIFGASSEGNLNMSRADGDPTFYKVTLDLQRLQRIADRVNLLVAAHGQLSDSPLLTAEQFGVGGMSFGRGYDPSEIIGDSGFAGKAELQWNVPGDISITHDNQVFGFYDVGQVWTRNAPATTHTETASSAGFGLRSRILTGAAADFTVALPLNRNVATSADQDPRYFFSLSQKF